jgi:hypothetical protein
MQTAERILAALKLGTYSMLIWTSGASLGKRGLADNIMEIVKE